MDFRTFIFWALYGYVFCIVFDLLVNGKALDVAMMSTANIVIAAITGLLGLVLSAFRN